MIALSTCQVELMFLSPRVGAWSPFLPSTGNAVAFAMDVSLAALFPF